MMGSFSVTPARGHDGLRIQIYEVEGRIGDHSFTGESVSE